MQTEDRGASHALIDTTVYYHGRVLHRRTNSYFDLLPLDGDREQALKLRLDEQHRTVLEEMRTGVIQLSIPRVEGLASDATAIPAEPPAMAEVRRKLSVELKNAKSWLMGKRASLQILVSEENGEPAVGAKVEAQIEGSARTMHVCDGDGGVWPGADRI